MKRVVSLGKKKIFIFMVIFSIAVVAIIINYEDSFIGITGSITRENFVENTTSQKPAIETGISENEDSGRIITTYVAE